MSGRLRARSTLLEARGETVRLNPERVGHRLKKLGLRTRPLSQSGNGLMFDKATVAGDSAACRGVRNGGYACGDREPPSSASYRK
jgi:hypothetical protein